MKKIWMAAVLAVAIATPAAAGMGQKEDWEIGPYAGWAWLDGYDSLEPEDGFLFGGRLGYFLTETWSCEGSAQRILSAVPDAKGGGNIFVDSLRENLLYNFRPGKAFRWHLTGGVGLERFDDTTAGSSNNVGFNAGGGIRYYFTDSLALRWDARYVWSHTNRLAEEFQGNIESNVGVTWSLGAKPPADGDHDGVPDRKDACPGTPSGASVDARGCSTDADGDGVLDGIDKCPDTPKGWPVDGKGCPKDSDGDGVPDGKDACPGTPKGASVDDRGCPVDSDGDGVYDGLDTCAGTPKGAAVDGKGCPKDSDGDGVLDGLDRCPGTPSGKKVDANGCPLPEPEPPKAPPVFQGKKTLVLEGVQFEANSAKLTAASSETLDRVAGELKEFPNIRVEIGGHTDSQGAEGYNMSLSEKRANAVRDYLASKGVDPSRMTAIGYGEAKPIADNATSEGRARNRRVEMTQLD